MARFGRVRVGSFSLRNYFASWPDNKCFKNCFSFVICDGQNKLDCLSLARYFSQFQWLKSKTMKGFTLLTIAFLFIIGDQQIKLECLSVGRHFIIVFSIVSPFNAKHCSFFPPHLWSTQASVYPLQDTSAWPIHYSFFPPHLWSAKARVFVPSNKFQPFIILESNRWEYDI